MRKWERIQAYMKKTGWQPLTVALDDEAFDRLREVQTRLHLRSLSETVRVLIRWAHEQDKEQRHAEKT